MKQIIEVPEGHTAVITQEGNKLTVEMVPAKKQDKRAFIPLKDAEKLRAVTSNIFASWRR